MKILLGIVIGAAIFSGANALAYSPVEYRQFWVDIEGEGNFLINKFVDPDNGNVCYLVGWENGHKNPSISCLKP